VTWTVDWPQQANADALDPAVKLLSERYAVACLTMLTLQRVGGAPVTILPATTARVTGWYGYWEALGAGEFFPVYPSAYDLQRWTNLVRTEALTLPGPVGQIVEVRVNNTVLDPAAYRVEDGQYLIRIDGEDWPNDLTGAFSVTYYNSHPVDEVGRHAAGVLAWEWSKLITGGKNCRLPSSVTNVSRQGLTFEVARGMFPEGMTGLPEVDAYILLWNPFGLRARPRVYSRDLPQHRQVFP
jgi:hypothetical protein